MILPIDEVLPELMAAVVVHPAVVLSAEPGAGKTTRVPVALLDEPRLAGTILMLEPRRLAAQRAAHYMARMRGEEVGATIGYRIRGEARVSSSTRIEIVTEGILTRMIQDAPDLPGIGVVIFDEFHERSIHADLGLSLTRNVQEHLRPDIRILIMSATLDGVAVSRLLNDAPVVQSKGKVFPVETRYLSRPVETSIESTVASTISNALRRQSGDLLVFLPGQREIRKVERLLNDAALDARVDVHTLFGDLSPDQQNAALRPARSGKRKVILSTSIAETSVTIEGIRVVVDSGLARAARFDPRRGMSGLVTTPVSVASADQRRGRAGREAAGVCFRLWTEEQQRGLPQFSIPEILAADLAPLALEFARWGSPDGKDLRFIDPPPQAHLLQAQTLLRQLGAVDARGLLTTHGKQMVELPVHPRLAHMLIKGVEFGLGSLACDVAALLEERDLLRGDRDADVDLDSRLDVLRNAKPHQDFSIRRILDQAKRLRSLLHIEQSDFRQGAGVLLALAYPERIGKRIGNRYQLSGGPHAHLPQQSLLSREEFLAIGEVDGLGSEVKIFLAAPLSYGEIRANFPERITTERETKWDSRSESVIAREVTLIGQIVLAKSAIPVDKETSRKAMTEGIRSLGLDALPWTTEAESFCHRSEWLRRNNFAGTDWPVLDRATLHATLEDWLAPFFEGIAKRSQLAQLNLTKILRSLFSYAQLSHLDREAPSHLIVPTGSRIALDYSGDQPVLAVRLQEMFGEATSPRVAGGKAKVLIHLLSPAGRPLAVTQDLESFWKNAYTDVRKEMRGRYPKHYWPENPLEATPTRRTKARM